MIINDVIFNADLETILTELVNELRLNDIPYIQKMKSTGDNIQVCCPYHKGGTEHNPSAGIRKTDGVFHCFACGETHSLQEMISFCFGHTDDMMGAYGWNWLLKNFATVQVEERKHVKLDLERSASLGGNSNTVSADNSNNGASGNNIQRYISEEELDSYRYYHPYWTKRGITDEHIIELFDLGYDAKTQSITFPVRDEKGNCLFIARRSVNTKWFNYPRDVEKPLYGLYELQQLPTFPRTLIITESMLDALSFWQIGKYAVALNGTGSALQFQQLRMLPCRKYILATDSDDAGMSAREKIRKNIKNILITEYMFPNGKKDANECTKEELLALEEIF